MITPATLRRLAAKPFGHFEIRAHAQAVADRRRRPLPDALRLNGTTEQLTAYILDNQ